MRPTFEHKNHKERYESLVAHAKNNILFDSKNARYLLSSGVIPEDFLKLSKNGRMLRDEVQTFSLFFSAVSTEVVQFLVEKKILTQQSFWNVIRYVVKSRNYHIFRNVMSLHTLRFLYDKQILNEYTLGSFLAFFGGYVDMFTTLDWKYFEAKGFLGKQWSPITGPFKNITDWRYFLRSIKFDTGIRSVSEYSHGKVHPLLIQVGAYENLGPLSAELYELERKKIIDKRATLEVQFKQVVEYVLAQSKVWEKIAQRGKIKEARRAENALVVNKAQLFLINKVHRRYGIRGVSKSERNVPVDEMKRRTIQLYIRYRPRGENMDRFAAKLDAAVVARYISQSHSMLFSDIAIVTRDPKNLEAEPISIIGVDPRLIRYSKVRDEEFKRSLRANRVSYTHGSDESYFTQSVPILGSRVLMNPAKLIKDEGESHVELPRIHNIHDPHAYYMRNDTKARKAHDRADVLNAGSSIISLADTILTAVLAVERKEVFRARRLQKKGLI